NVIGFHMRHEIDPRLLLQETVRTPTESATPTEVVTGSQSDTVQEIEIDRIARFAELVADTYRAVKVSSKVQIGVAAELPSPPGQDISSGNAVANIGGSDLVW